MENNVSSLVASQIPEYLRESAPLFLGFLELYYKYLEQNSVLNVQDITKNRDVDRTTDDYITDFYNTYGEYLPVDTAFDRRNLIKILNDVYAAKGTEKALKVIFKALYNEDLVISYPSKNILKASDGEWVRESFITISVLFGELTTQNVELEFTNELGDFSIITSRIEYITQDTVRCYFVSYSLINIVDNQRVTRKTNGAVSFIGNVIKSPTSIDILSHGQGWQVGQVIVVPGNAKNTIARVTAITTGGGISKLEIIEYGDIHADGQILTISPYKYKPIGGNTNITSTLISINPNVFEHTIDTSDTVEEISDICFGYGNNTPANAYFLEDYVEVGYNGSVVFESAYIFTKHGEQILDTGLTLEEWLASRSILQYKKANITHLRGVFNSDSGKISNQDIKTQDNYFYQTFSYLINSSKNLSDFRTLLNITHPAGTKVFANISKENSFFTGFTTDRSMSIDTVHFVDETEPTESHSITTNKYFTGDDFATTADQSKIYSIKYFNDDVSAISSDESTSEKNSYTLTIDPYFASNYVEDVINIYIG